MALLMVLACCRTGLTMVWRLFIIEPVKVLWCGGLEAVASLITGAPHRYGCARTRVGNSTRRVLLGEADHWTEGFADALADDMEGRVEDLGSAGIAMAAMDNVARRHETKVAKAKLAAAHAFHEAVSSAQPLDVCSHDRSLTPARGGCRAWLISRKSAGRASRSRRVSRRLGGGFLCDAQWAVYLQE